MQDFSVLITVALPSSGPELLRIARLMAPVQHLRVAALHCRTDLASGDGTNGEGEDANPLEPLLNASDDIQVDPIVVDSEDVEEHILSTAREERSDLVLMGWYRPLVPDGEPPGPLRGILERAECDVAVFLARQRHPLRSCLAPFHGGRHDRRALELAARMARSAGIPLTVLHVVTPDRRGDEPGTGLSEIVEDFADGRVRLKVVESDDAVAAAIQEAWTGYDLIVAGASEVWSGDASLFPDRLQRLAFATPSSLLVVHSGHARHRDGRSSAPDIKTTTPAIDAEASPGG